MSEPVEIKLREKYRRVSRGRYKSASSNSTKSSRKKIGYDKHVAKFGVPAKRLMVMEPSGRTHMVLERAA